MPRPEVKRRRNTHRNGRLELNSNDSDHDEAYRPHVAKFPSYVPSRGARKLPGRSFRQSTRTSRTVLAYTALPAADDFDEDSDLEATYSDLQSTDSEAAEDERIERSMGVIRKKTATRGTEGGTKYHCDVCSIDVTSTVCTRIMLQASFNV